MKPGGRLEDQSGDAATLGRVLNVYPCLPSSSCQWETSSSICSQHLEKAVIWDHAECLSSEGQPSFCCRSNYIGQSRGIDIHEQAGNLFPCREWGSDSMLWDQLQAMLGTRVKVRLAMPNLGFPSQPLGSIVIYLHSAACWTVESHCHGLRRSARERSVIRHMFSSRNWRTWGYCGWKS